MTSSNCFDDPGVAGTPPSGFDTQVGSATGTLSTGGQATYDWIYVDGTTGGSFADSVELTIRDSGGNVILSVGAQRPNTFDSSGGVWTFGSSLPT